MTKKVKTEMAGEAQVLTAEEMAGWLRIPKSTLYKLCHEGEIPATKIGRHWRFDRQTVETWLRNRMARSEETTGG